MKRLWGIRHLRYWWKWFRFRLWWNCEGCYMGSIPNPADLEYLRAVRAGRA